MSSDDSSRPSGGLELRRSPRFPVPPTGGAVSVVGAHLVNVSIHGALIESLVPMESEAVMPLRLLVGGQKVDIEARVVQCTASQGERRRVYRIGLEFLAIPAPIRDLLTDALKLPFSPLTGPPTP
jgi:hypothetical protein